MDGRLDKLTDPLFKKAGTCGGLTFGAAGGRGGNADSLSFPAELAAPKSPNSASEFSAPFTTDDAACICGAGVLRQTGSKAFRRMCSDNHSGSAPAEPVRLRKPPAREPFLTTRHGPTCSPAPEGPEKQALPDQRYSKTGCPWQFPPYPEKFDALEH